MTQGLQDLYQKQAQLDRTIVEKHALKTPALFRRKTLAFLVELGELANETRCFKYWSLKSASSRETILFEFVDGLHFLLSLGNDLDFNDEGNITFDDQSEVTGEALSEMFLMVYDRAQIFLTQKDERAYYHLMSGFLQLGRAMGYDMSAIITTYDEKNAINFQRQDEGY